MRHCMCVCVCVPHVCLCVPHVCVPHVCVPHVCVCVCVSSKHIAEFRGAIEETTIEDIHHQTNQWQLNTYRENNAPSHTHMMKYYNTRSRSGSEQSTTHHQEQQQLVMHSSPSRSSDGVGVDYTSVMNGQGHHEAQRKSGVDDKLTSMLLGFDDDNESECVSEGPTHTHTHTHARSKERGYSVSESEIKEIPYIDYPQVAHDEKDESEEARISAESARIIHLQVLREKVS
jgi:hypothetical protein